MAKIRKIILLFFTLHMVKSIPPATYSDNGNVFETPNFAVGNDSQEGLYIASKIAQLFRERNRPIQTDYPSSEGFETKMITSTTKGTSINFNFNIAVDVADGNISQIRLPHGDLLLLFVAADENNRVNINPIDFRNFLAKTIGPTHMAKVLENGAETSNGIVFMAWARDSTAEKYSKSTSSKKGNRMDLSKNRPMHVDELHEHITNSEYIKNKWDNGIAPKFPFYHGINTLGNSVETNYRNLDRHNSNLLRKPVSASPSIGIHSLNKGSTKTKQCQTTNGITTCKDGSDTIRRCQGFTIGGNCAGQNDVVDKIVRETPDFIKNNLQMGNFIGNNQRLGVNGMSPSRLETNTQRNKPSNRFGLRRTPTPIPHPVVTTTKVAERVDSSTSMSPELQEMRDHIMEMEAHDLRDAIMDPMMLAMGTIMAMSGAYIAMVMAESSAANALAIGALNG